MKQFTSFRDLKLSYIHTSSHYMEKLSRTGSVSRCQHYSTEIIKWCGALSTWLRLLLLDRIRSGQKYHFLKCSSDRKNSFPEFSINSMRTCSRLKAFIPFNSLGPSDAIWRQGFRSKLFQVMVCCLRAPSHYLNQCWFIISEVQRHSQWRNFIQDVPAINR